MSFFEYNGKRLFFEEHGAGAPLLLLHGNTASSAIFGEIAPLLAEKYRVLTLDFLGCGNSERVPELCADLWYDEAMQAAALLDMLKIGSVYAVGTSGGAIAAISLALERPELVKKLVADSFEGERALPEIVSILKTQRENSKKDSGARFFYQLMNGEDWERAVDADTAAVSAHAETIGEFYHRPVSEIRCPVLFTGSRGDEFCPGSFYDTLFAGLTAKIKNSRAYIFEHGGHPSMLSSRDEFVALAEGFFNE